MWFVIICSLGFCDPYDPIFTAESYKECMVKRAMVEKNLYGEGFAICYSPVGAQPEE